MCCVAGEHCFAKIYTYCEVCYFKERKLGFCYTFIPIVKVIVFVSHTATFMDSNKHELNLTKPFTLLTK